MPESAPRFTPPGVRPAVATTVFAPLTSADGATTTQLSFTPQGSSMPESAPRFTPPAVAPAAVATRTSTTPRARPASVSYTAHVYMPAHRRYTYTDVHGTLTARARFSPVRLGWGYTLSAALQMVADGEVTEKASAYTLPKGRKINYSDFHVKAANYHFHSRVTKIGANHQYQLAINFEFPGVENGEHGTYILYVRHEFEIKP